MYEFARLNFFFFFLSDHEGFIIEGTRIQKLKRISYINQLRKVSTLSNWSSLYIPFSTTTALIRRRQTKSREGHREMDLDWEDFFKDYEWLIVFLKGMVKPAAALVVVLLAVVLSYSQNLSLEGEMIYSVFRAFLQLSVIGFVLQFIFNQENAGWIILAYLFMVSSNQIQDLLCFSIFVYSKTF